MKLDQIFNENNDEILFDTGEIKVKDQNQENWEAIVYGVENQRFFTEALREGKKEHLTFETNKGTMYGAVDIDAFDSANEENVVTMKGAGKLQELNN